MSNLFDSIRNRTEAAHGRIISIESKLNQVIPELESIHHHSGKSSPKLEAAIITLNEVVGLILDVKDGLGASEAHFAEALESVQDIRNEVVKARHDSAHTATLTRHINLLASDWVQLRFLLLGVTREKPELRGQIQEWLKEDAPE